MAHIAKENQCVTEYSPNQFCAEVSDLGWRDWPLKVTTTMGNGLPFAAIHQERDADSNVQWTLYKQEDGCITLKVLNQSAWPHLEKACGGVLNPESLTEFQLAMREYENFMGGMRELLAPIEPRARRLKSLEKLRSGRWKTTVQYAEQHDAHVIRFRSYQRAYMEREYRHAGERMS